jgi:hypothetical protein
MSLIHEIKAAQVRARITRSDTVAILTTLLGEAEMIGKNAGNRETTDEEVIAIAKKFIKNIDETINAIRKVEMTDEKAAALRMAFAERGVVEMYLPKQMTVEQLRDVIQKIITGMKMLGADPNMGLVMKELKGNFDGQYDGKAASTITKEELQ